MNFELSVSLIWLVVFDVTGVAIVIRRKLWRKCWRRICKHKRWMALLLPVWVTVSVAWSLNVVRGVLTVGVMWAVVAAVLLIWLVAREVIVDFERFWGRWWKGFFAAGLVACVWCVVQCVMDLAGVPREASLMCAGCTYRMFGFPHPNGWAIEPQFMGNLLLAPALISAACMMGLKKVSSTPFAHARRHGVRSLRTARKPFGTWSQNSFFKPIWSLGVFAATLFLTFSRGAIYAFVVGLGFLSGYAGVRKWGWRRILAVWGVVAFAGVVAVNVQGVMAQVSRTDDTYATGVAKVVNQLTLGVVDIRGGDEGVTEVEREATEVLEEVTREKTGAPEGTQALASEDNRGEEAMEQAVFDGYVEESTNTRVRLTEAAVEIWRRDVQTVLSGVGIGGAGRALYDNGHSPAPKEIVQNEYASLLLETGVVGVVLAVITGVVIVREVMRGGKEAGVPLRTGVNDKRVAVAGARTGMDDEKMMAEVRTGVVLALMVAYGVTLCFFSGLPNALQVYLLPGVVWVMWRKNGQDERC